MRPLVIVPTYNERDNLPARRARCWRSTACSVLDRRRRLAGRDRGTSPTRWRRRAPAGSRCCIAPGRAGSDARTSTGMRQRCAPTRRTSARWTRTSRTTRRTLPRLLAASAHADLVIGSRYVPGGTLRNWPTHRVVLSAFANWYVRAITRLPVRDCTSGFRCWRRELLARLPLDSHRLGRLCLPGRDGVGGAGRRRPHRRDPDHLRRAAGRAARRCRAA